MSTTPTLDLSFATNGIQVEIPAPDAGLPQLTYGRQSPSQSWRATTDDSRLIGYLGVYDLGSGKLLLLTVYGRNPARIASWSTLKVPGLDAAVTIEQLEAQPAATVVILSADQRTPPETAGIIYMRAAIALTEPVNNAAIKGAPQQGGIARVTTVEVATPVESMNATSPTSPPARLEGRPVLVARLSVEHASPPVSRAAEWPPASDKASPGRGILIPLETLVARSISWLVHPYIAKGKITIIAGEPGMGKSMLTADLAASVSVGRSWGAGNEPSSGGRVVIVSPEDDAHETIKPRLLAADACQNQIHILANSQAPVNISALLQEIEALADVRLLIIDPISAYLSGKDMNRAGDMRQILMRLAAWAEAQGIAVVLVTHLNKSGVGPSPLSRVVGSQAFGAVARAVFFVCADAEDRERRLFLPVKDNIGTSRQGLVFQIEEVTLPSGIKAARVVFNEEPTDLTATDALRALQAQPKQTSAFEEAREFLRSFLQAGEQSAEAVKDAADAHGISMATLRRGRKALGIKPRKAGMGEGWVWTLPAL